MLDKYLSVMPILTKSTDEILQRADIMNNVVVPIGIGLIIVLSIFGRKDK